MIPLWLGIGVVLGIVISMPGLIVLLRRATHRAREAEREARHAQRLAELGSMTSGLAHEIKNPLSTVGLNAQLLREDLVDLEVSSSDRSRLTDRVDALAREVDRLGSILAERGRPDEAEGSLAQSIRLYRAADNRPGLVRALSQSCAFLSAQLRLSEAEEALEEARQELELLLQEELQ